MDAGCREVACRGGVAGSDRGGDRGVDAAGRQCRLVVCRGLSGRGRVPGRRARRAPLWRLRARSLWPPRRGPGRRHRSPRERSRSRPRRGRGRPPRLPRRCCRRRRRPGPVLMPWRPSARRKRTPPPRAARSRASRAPRSPGARAPGRALRGRTRASRGPPRRVRGRPRGRFAARRPARPSARPLPTAPRGSGREARRTRAPPRSPLAVASASLRPDVPRRPRSCRRASPLRSSHWPPWSLPCVVPQAAAPTHETGDSPEIFRPRHDCDMSWHDRRTPRRRKRSKVSTFCRGRDTHRVYGRVPVGRRLRASGSGRGRCAGGRRGRRPART